ncbi:C40 family peptidase [Spiractinospora alimapuensis]|uniref:C40 family peptidase n=1 Tax=Spiractinospora alimapuensis TaxID=2820884 RepID=UPI001F394C68|nr:C40 family peptidase [Spiractinospora alimapuensis]QVQ50405.1 C40 family peptidase [Spiractinospora alimapuensis]
MHRRPTMLSSLTLFAVAATTMVATPAAADPTDAESSDTQEAAVPLPADADLFIASADALPEELLSELTERDGVDDVLLASAARLGVDDRDTAVVGADPESLARFGGSEEELSDVQNATVSALREGTILPAEHGGLEPGERLGEDEENDTWRLTVGDAVDSRIPGVDGYVAADRAEELGMPVGNAALVSAPGADVIALQEELTEKLPPESGVQLLPGAELEETEGTGDDGARWDGDRLSSESVESAIDAAESKLGAPYVWGGSGPDNFDCSGLVQWAFAQAGVSLPRVTHEQWTVGPRLDYSEAERGDLLFWRTDPNQPDYISHVAIYLGDGQMIEAPSSGQVVRVTDVRFSGFAGVVRISPN